MFLHDQLDHRGKAGCMDDFFYSGIWTQSRRRCEIFHARFHCDHVALQGRARSVFDTGGTFWSNRCVDRHVRGLDDPVGHLCEAVFQRSLAEQTCNIKNMNAKAFYKL